MVGERPGILRGGVVVPYELLRLPVIAHASFKFISSGLGHDIDDGAGKLSVLGGNAYSRRFDFGENLRIHPLPGGTDIKIPDIDSVELIIAGLIIGPVGHESVSISLLRIHDQAGSLLDDIKKGKPAAGKLLKELLAEVGRHA
ncbi:MAG: hypothetical protein MUP28_02960 [Candidatus Aminicenantes bacterium]|nr:hypothetical protein [Candidatus Aminicenantes bacterium]